jgi:hypothetical protein
MLEPGIVAQAHNLSYEGKMIAAPGQSQILPKKGWEQAQVVGT